MRIISWLMVLLALLPGAHASIVLSQVLYDPLGTESGGEAVELRNDGASAVNISNWVLTTETSAADATIPAGTMLAAGATYLIADAGWNASRDNALWRAADREETITLANGDSGVALKDASGAAVDAVGWGAAADIKAGLFEGTPANEVAAGKALVRTKDTNNNIADFSEGDPAFFSGDIMTIIVNVTVNSTPVAPLPLGAALREDDDPASGVQLSPSAGATRALHLGAYYNGTRVSASWFGKTVDLQNAGGVWAGELPFEYWYAPGAQTILVSTETGNMTLPVTIRELRAAKLRTTTLALQASPGGSGKGTVLVENQGNVPVRVSWNGADFTFRNQTIPFENLRISDATINPAETKSIDVRLDVPATSIPGEYRAIVAMAT